MGRIEHPPMNRATTSIFIAAALAVGLPAVASAEERTCRGTIGARTLDNVRVPDGASCTLEGTKVKGRIRVESGARLLARGVRVVGNVQGENAARVVVRRGSRFAATRSTRTFSARRTSPRRPAAATGSGTTRRTSARVSDARLTRGTGRYRAPSHAHPRHS